MKLELLSEYVTLVKHQSFTNAARELYLTQPSLSGHISSMEKELGFFLVDRNSSSFGITPAGSTFLEYAQQIIDSYAEAKSRCLGIAAEARPLKIGSFPVNSSCYRALSEMTDVSFEFVDLDLETSSLAAIAKGKVDLALIAGFSDNASVGDEAEEKGITYRALGTGRGAVCMMRSHPLAAKVELDRLDLRGSTVVINSGACFDSWKYAIIQMIGEDLNLEFRLSPVRYHSNLARIDLRDCIHICGLEAMRGWFAHRDDMVIYDRLGGEELLYPEGLIYLTSNASAAALAERLSQFSVDDATMGLLT
jgi:DNA-binding transcriptional LysR family regulator